MEGAEVYLKSVIEGERERDAIGKKRGGMEFVFEGDVIVELFDVWRVYGCKKWRC